MEEIRVKAPAKINLGLHIVSKRDDGYHNIETIFYPIDLYDLIIFKNSKKFKFTMDSSELNLSSDNIVLKAKDLLEAESKKEINVGIHLKKNIPVGAGLGGGSSDAAAVLTALNKFCTLNIDEKKLSILALRLGSDVPFFLNPEPCYASARGEVIEKRNFRLNFPVLIVNPGIHITTKWAYENITPKTPEYNLKDLTQKDLDAPEKLSTVLKNDFEDIVLEKYPLIKKLKEEILSMGALVAIMSGSGSTFFSVFKDNSSAYDALKRLRKKYFVHLYNKRENT